MEEKEALKYLIEDVKRQETIEIDGRIYATRGLSPIKEPIIDCLTVHTLTGIKDYLLQEGSFNPFIGEFSEHEKVFIHIKDHDDVIVYGIASGKWKQREQFIHAILPNEKRFDFDEWMSIENMIIELQAKFDHTEDIDKILSYLSRVEEGAIQVSEDDGVSQVLTVKRKIGGAIKEQEKAPCRVELAPYRTFIEIDQPKSTFVLRLKEGGRVALFDADGGKWKLEAIQKIKDWLSRALPQDIAIIA